MMDDAGCDIPILGMDEYYSAPQNGIPEKFEEKLSAKTKSEEFKETIHGLWLSSDKTKLLRIQLIHHLVLYKDYYIKSDYGSKRLWKHVAYSHRHDDTLLKDPDECRMEFRHIFEGYVTLLMVCGPD